MQDDFVDILLHHLHTHHADPSFIKLELTESIAVENLQHAVAKMKLLKKHGFELSMDDFGTGYSSLSYLKNLPFDYIKIDQSFVRNALTNENDKQLVKIITDISREFHFLVIAEGVETAKHVAFVKENGCDFYQGYFTSKPLPLAAFKKLLV
jgi:EAL domain-containing protein (putative c-di-GMP-specific phosphodiesterase class I)